MSIPRSLRLPEAARTRSIETPFGPVAALCIDPASIDPASIDPESHGVPAHDGHRATVLLIPGFTGSKEDFVALLEPLAARGFPVVAIDQRGQYETVGPEAPDAEAYSLDRFAEEACAVADAIGGDLHVVGHSFGGLVAQSMALRDPAHIRSLTLLGTGPGALPVEAHADLGTFVMGLPLVGKAKAWELMRERSAAARGPATPEVEEFVLRRFLASSLGSLVGIADILRSAPDRIDELGALGIPTQVVFGENDDAWPPDWQRAVAGRLGAPVRMIDGAGHSPNVDDPAATADALVAFFSSVEAESSA